MAVKTYQKGSKEKLSKNFKVSEFACNGKDCCTTVLIDEQLVKYLQQIRDHFGKPITITSAYRCTTHNKKVGGATGSRHAKGQAADFGIAGVKPAEIAKYAESIGIKGIGLYETAKDGYFVHIDTREKKSFWYGQGQAYRATFGGAPLYTRDKFLAELMGALGVEREDDLLQATVTIGAKYNNRHACIKPVQKWLKALGYEEIGSTDGIAGAKFTSAMLHFQGDTGCTMTGIAEEWGRTWQELMAAERGVAQ